MKLNLNLRVLLSFVFLLIVVFAKGQTNVQVNYVENLKKTVSELYESSQAYYQLSVAPVEQELKSMPPDVSKEQLDEMIDQLDKDKVLLKKLTADYSDIRNSINNYIETILSLPCDPRAVSALSNYNDPQLSSKLEQLKNFENYSLGLKAPIEAIKGELERNGWNKIDEGSAALQQFDKAWDNSPYILVISKNSSDGIPILNDCVKKVISLRMRGFANCKDDMDLLLSNLTPRAGEATNPSNHLNMINEGSMTLKRIIGLNKNINNLESQLQQINNINVHFNELGQQRYDVVEHWYDMRESLDKELMAACKYCLSQPCDTLGAFTWLRGEIEPLLVNVFHKSYKTQRDNYIELLSDYNKYTTEISNFFKRMKIFTNAGQLTSETKNEMKSMLQSLDYCKKYYSKRNEQRAVSSPYLDGIIDDFKKILDSDYAGSRDGIEDLNCIIRGDDQYYLSLTEDVDGRNRSEISRESLEESKGKVKVKGVTFKMIKVDGGSFLMGGSSSSHNVTLSSYFIGQTEVTQELWKAVMGNNPSSYYYYKGSNCPVENVSWNDCQKFIKKLNELTGMCFRLPTEAEWEFAARGGNKSKNCIYSGSDDLDDVAWYDNNSVCGHLLCGLKDSSNRHDFKTYKHSRQVSKKDSNELDIFDMSGNVFEWCQDWYDKGYYDSSSSNVDPVGPSMGSSRVIRGGSWDSPYKDCKIDSRNSRGPEEHDSRIGFRLAL